MENTELLQNLKQKQETEKQANIQRRKDMESSVASVNKHLTDRVAKMTADELYANMHPYDREFFTVRRFITDNTL